MTLVHSLLVILVICNALILCYAQSCCSLFMYMLSSYCMCPLFIYRGMDLDEDEDEDEDASLLVFYCCLLFYGIK
jgi:hypothetical protein